MAGANEGQAFIAYVREESDRVERIPKILAAAGVRLRRDPADLWPGEDWRWLIRPSTPQSNGGA